MIECSFPPCHNRATNMVMRPFMDDEVPLCDTHTEWAVALIKALIEEQEAARGDDAQTAP